MRSTTLFSILVLFAFNIQAQESSEIDDLNKIREELVLQKQALTDSINSIDLQINYLKAKHIELIESGEVALCHTKIRSEAKIRNSPDIFGDVVTLLSANEDVEVYTYHDGYWLIRSSAIEGYTSEMYLVETSEMKNLAQRKTTYNKKQSLIDKYGESTANRILTHQIWIGMTKEMARESVGYPKDTNRSTGSWGVHEQWVYDNKYLYFENGKLTSWQD